MKEDFCLCQNHTPSLRECQWQFVIIFYAKPQKLCVICRLNTKYRKFLCILTSFIDYILFIIQSPLCNKTSKNIILVTFSTHYALRNIVTQLSFYQDFS